MIILALSLVVLFSPNGGIEKDIVSHLNGAKSTVDIQAYAFTNDAIIAAVVAAKNRGVAVRVILDKSWQNEAPKAQAAFTAAGMVVLIDAKHAIAHTKVIIIDHKIVYTGSYNFTYQAEHMNVENSDRITDNKLAQKFTDCFNLHLGHSYDSLTKSGSSNR